MGTVYRPTYTKPLPAGARTLTRDGKPFAEWVDEAGKRRQAPMTGTTAKRPGIRVKATTYLAQYRDADGIERREPTGCRTLDAARAVLAELERRVEKVRAGVLTATDLRHPDTINGHVQAVHSHEHSRCFCCLPARRFLHAVISASASGLHARSGNAPGTHGSIRTTKLKIAERTGNW